MAGRLRALVRKNWQLLFRRKRAAVTALELLLPLAALLSLGIWRLLATNRNVPDGWSTATLGPPSSAALDGGDGGLMDSIVGALDMSADPLSLFSQSPSAGVQRFIAHETSVPGLLVSLVERAVEDPRWLVDTHPELDVTRCAVQMLVNGRVSTDTTADNALDSSCGGWMAPHRLAIVPDVPFTRKYLLSVLTAWHPSVILNASEGSSEESQLVIPGIQDVVTFFQSEGELETYVRSDSYGVNASNPKIHAALVFRTYPVQENSFGSAPETIDYSIRLSSASKNAVPTASDNGHDEEQLWDPLRDHQVLTDELETYAYEGFATLQSLITRFVTCRPLWNSSTGTLATSTAATTVDCGQDGSTAVSEDADALDTALVQALQLDVKLNSSWERAQSLTTNSSETKTRFNMTSIASSLSSEAKQALLSPMKVLPQPLTGSCFVAMPVSQLHASAFYDRSRQVFPLALTGAYLFPVAKMIMTYVGESESQVRAFLRTRGVRDRDVIFSWFFSYGLLLASSALLQLVVVSAFGIFPHSSAVLVLALLMLYGWSLWCYAFVMSACVPRAHAGAYVGVLLLVTLLFLDQRLLAHLGSSSSAVVNLLAPLAAARGLRALLAAESMQRGISWHNLDQSYGGAALSESLAFLAIDCGLYTLLGLYLERVLPKWSGEGSDSDVAAPQPDPWYFPLLPSFWISCWPFHRSLHRGNKQDGPSDGITFDGPATVPSSVVSTAYGRAEGVLADGVDVVDRQRPTNTLPQVGDEREDSTLSPLGTMVSSQTTSTTRMQSGAQFLHMLHPRPGLTDTGGSSQQEPAQRRHKARRLYLHRVTAGVSTLRSGYKTVLDGINLRLSTSKISCILGPPSSGKSTLLSVLTLRSPQTSGVVTISGSSLSWPQYVATHPDALGFCFQHDVLFPDLTVLDHFEFYARLAFTTSCRSSEATIAAQRVVDKQLRQFELLHLSDVKTKDLSAGARRSLSIALALLSYDADRSHDVGEEDGAVHFVFLDEPTLGMGPLRRQRTWDILRSIIRSSQEALDNQRRHLGIVVATSDAEEAEAIGDEIAVLSGGKTTIVGTPDELKLRTHAGYSLSFTKGPEFKESEAMELVTTTCCVPDGGVIQVTDNSATQLVVCIPAEHSSSFSRLFQRLETQSVTVLGATAYTLALLTLDDAVAKIVDTMSLRTLDTDRVVTDSTGQTTVNVVDEEATLGQRSGGRRATTGSAMAVAAQTWALTVEQLTIAFKRHRVRTLLLLCGPVAVLLALLAATGAFSTSVRSPSLTLSTGELSQVVGLGSGDASSVHVPYYCHDGEEDSDWCSSVFASNQWDESTKPRELGSFLPLVGDEDDSVELFGVGYTTEDESELLLLQFSWQLFLSGFTSRSGTSPATQAASVSTNQLGAYLVANSSSTDGIWSFDTIVNTSSPHAAGIFKAEMHQAIYRALSNNASVSLTVHNHPLPFSRREQRFMTLQEDGVTTNAFLAALAFSYLPATIVWRLSTAWQAPSSAKHQRLLGGMSVAAFWLANFIVDVLLHTLSTAVFVLVLLAVQVASWYGDPDTSDNRSAGPFGAMTVLLVLFGLAVCPFAYGIAIVFSRTSKAASESTLKPTTRLVHVYAFIVFAVLSYSVFLVVGPIERAGPAKVIAFQNILSFLPQFALAFGLNQLGHERREDALVSGVDGDSVSMLDPFADTVTGVSILYLGVTAVLYLSVVIAFDSSAVSFVQVRAFLTRTQYEPTPESSKPERVSREDSRELSVHVDPRVHDEAKKVDGMLTRLKSRGRTAEPTTGAEPVPVILVHDVSKVFVSPRSRSLQPKRGMLSDWLHGVKHPSQEVVAVRDVSFHVPRGECLTLFGADGSGKSTLMQILSGQLLPSRGRVVLAGTDAVWNQQQLSARRSVGYCPAQDHFLQDELTVLEHLVTHARLNEPGKSVEQCHELAKERMSQFGLSRVHQRLAGALLVGERRRLSLALAVVGSPDVLLLDSPTLGLEGKARQQVWTLLRSMVTSGSCQSMVVATSNLAECQALADRVGIMADGALAFIDTYPTLQRDFEYGWVLDVRPAPPTYEEATALMRLAFARAADTSSSTDWAAEAAGLVVYPGQLESVFDKLGRPDWVARIAADHPTGCWIAGTLASGQPVAAPALLRWWVGELRHEALAAAIEQTFGAEYVRLLRREPHACRFQLLFDDAELRLSQVFKVLEAAKQRRVVELYAVSPASFASVADTFARTARAQRLLRLAGSAP